MTGAKLWHKRHHDFEPFDRILMRVIPRYKQSGLSGDEWRQHVEVSFYFKGEQVGAFGARDMQTASMMLGAELLGQSSPIPQTVIKLDETLCDQPSCTNPPVFRCVLKDLFSRSGEKIDYADTHGQKYFRKFCAQHATRGDCGREDADDNYIKEPI